jgi:hypothetical protein
MFTNRRVLIAQKTWIFSIYSIIIIIVIVIITIIIIIIITAQFKSLHQQVKYKFIS